MLAVGVDAQFVVDLFVGRPVATEFGDVGERRQETHLCREDLIARLVGRILVTGGEVGVQDSGQAVEADDLVLEGVAHLVPRRFVGIRAKLDG